MKIAEAFVELRIDRAKADAEVRSSAQQMTRTFASIFSVAAFTKGVQSMISSASDLQQAVGGTEAVFGTAAKTIEEFAKTSASSFGISERAARELTSTIGAMLKGFGFTQDEAAKTSVQVAQLGADLSAAFGGNPEEAVQALGSALRGEFDPLERFGVSLTAASISAKAVEMGLAASSTEVDANAKATAALQLITEQAADVSGQFGREIGTAAGQTAVAKAEAEDAAATMGEAFLPVYTTAVEVIRFLVDAFAELPKPVQIATVALVGLVALSGPIGTVKNLVVDLAGAFVKAGVSASTMGFALGGVAALIATGIIAYKIYNGRKEEAKKITDNFVEALKAEASGQNNAARAAIAANIAADEALNIREKLGLSAEQLAAIIEGDTVPAFEAFRTASDDAFKNNDFSALNDLAAQFGVNTADLADFVQAVDGYASSMKNANAIVAEQVEVEQALGLEQQSTGTTTKDLAQETGTLAEKQKAAAEAAEAQRDAIRDLYNELLSQLDAQRAYERQVDDTDGAIAELDATLLDHKSTLEDIDDAARDAADAAIAQAEAFAESKGAADGSRESIELQIQELYTLASTLAPDSPLRARLIEYIDELGKIPPTVDTVINYKINAPPTRLNGNVYNPPPYPGGLDGNAATPYPMARGGLVRARPGGMLALLAEAGRDEAVLPLGDRSRLMALLGDPAIGGPVADVMGMSGGVSRSVTMPVKIITYGAERRYVAELRRELALLERELA